MIFIDIKKQIIQKYLFQKKNACVVIKNIVLNFAYFGNGEQLYKDHLNDKINFIKNKILTKLCHTLERDFDEIYLELINIYKRVSFRKYVQEYNNKKILALKYHRLKENEKCIKDVLNKKRKLLIWYKSSK